jgi:hypothetical protein
MDKDSLANVSTVVASGFSMVSTEMWLTIAVLSSALVLNLVRIYFQLKNRG